MYIIFEAGNIVSFLPITTKKWLVQGYTANKCESWNSTWGYVI